MAQHDQVIDNAPGLAVRTDLNAALAALFSSSSGPVAPVVTVPGQVWFDTSTVGVNRMWMRNQANSLWLPMLTINAAINQGDLLVGQAGGGGLSALALGAALQMLRVNAAGTGLEYAPAPVSASFRPPDFWAREEQPSGTGPQNGGNAVYVTRIFNTLKRNVIAGASMAANQIILPIGNYWAAFTAPIYIGTGNATHKAKLFNVTDGADVDFSKPDFRGGSQFAAGQLLGYAFFTIAAVKTFELRQRGPNGIPMGTPAAFGDVEIYSEITLWKV